MPQIIYEVLYWTSIVALLVGIGIGLFAKVGAKFYFPSLTILYGIAFVLLGGTCIVHVCWHVGDIRMREGFFITTLPLLASVLYGFKWYQLRRHQPANSKQLESVFKDGWSN